MCRVLYFLLISLTALSAYAVNPTATNYSFADCQGSAKPYSAPTRPVDVPDSLTAVMINHVGRHGARYAASPAHTATLAKALKEAERQGTITPLGRQLMKTVDRITVATGSRWGQLDSLGAAEQRGIASRMYASFPHLFGANSVCAISSYVPRCVMSMYEFTHQLALLDRNTELTASSGKRFSPLMRFFSENEEYKNVVKSPEITGAIDAFTSSAITMEPLRRVLGRGFRMGPDSIAVAMAEYSVLSGMEAIGMTSEAPEYFSLAEYNSLWSIFNIRQYYDRTQTTVSSIPADIAKPLLEDLISTTDDFIAATDGKATVNLRFGHAETLMPLLSLMRLPGCLYLTRHPDTVGLHWRDFDIIPMAANLQMILFRSDTGRYYMRIDLNEQPVAPIAGSKSVYVPWPVLRQRLLLSLPLS